MSKKQKKLEKIKLNLEDPQSKFSEFADIYAIKVSMCTFLSKNLKQILCPFKCILTS